MQKSILQFQPSGARLLVEIAYTPEEISRGLMFRTVLEPYAGMLFVMPSESIHRMWMKDVFLPGLDMIFVSSQSVVVGILEQVPKGPPYILWGVEEPSKWVIEASAGWVKLAGVKMGDRVYTE
jgi:uncharacterized protein